MAYSYVNARGKTYFLHSKTVTIGGREKAVYFFSKDIRDEYALDKVPAGYIVSEIKNGLPVVKRLEARKD